VKPAPFTYHAPESVADACALLARHADDAKVLAGGQSLVPMLALRLTRFAHLVDLNRIAALQGVARENGSLVVGAGTRQRVMERDPAVAAAVPLLARATPLVGHFQIRNRGTVGGSLAHADPASEYPAVALALDAEFEIAHTSETRRVPAAEFFTGTWTTAIADDEMLVATRFPVWPGPAGFAIEEVARRHGDFALAGAVCAAGAAGQGALALFGVGSTPVRVAEADDALRSDAPAADVAEAAARALDPPGDVHATSATRRRIAKRLVEIVVTRSRKERDARR
jgi:aerobic carbon-monoxide dehydrogenase medium subunit